MFKFIIIALASLQMSAPSKGQRSADKFIDRFRPIAQELNIEYGIPVSIILGVSMIESGNGTSINAKQLHNYFGVKGRNSLKKRKSAYKQFDSPEDAFREFCAMISRKKYYDKLKGNDDYSQWLTTMNAHGYASAKGKWIADIKKVIRKYKLHLYDAD